MKNSPLQLIRYLVAEVSCSANPAFDPSKNIEGGPGSFSVKAVSTQQNSPENIPAHSWSVEMTIAQALNEGVNFPYKYQITMIGFFACAQGLPPEAKEERFVRINGSSILYGIARELIRSLTSTGPWGQVMIPTISFYETESKPSEETAAKT